MSSRRMEKKIEEPVCWSGRPCAREGNEWLAFGLQPTCVGGRICAKNWTSTLTMNVCRGYNIE